jgi:excisionase family DNA binding protein
MNHLLTVKQAAKVPACSEAAIRKWIYQKKLRAFKAGRLVRVSEEDLWKFIGNAGVDTRSKDQ